MTISDVASLIMALATTLSLLYISRQVNVTRKQTKGQFLLALDEQFKRSEGILIRLVTEQDFTPVGVEWAEVWGLMSIFERISIMVEDKILEVGLIDRLYGFQLLNLIGNEHVYQRVKSSGAEWQDFIDLCHAIADHRRRPGNTKIELNFIERVSHLDKETHNTNNPFGF